MRAVFYPTTAMRNIAVLVLPVFIMLVIRILSQAGLAI